MYRQDFNPAMIKVRRRFTDNLAISIFCPVAVLRLEFLILDIVALRIHFMDYLRLELML